MSAPEAPEVKPPRKAGVPRWAALALAPFVWLIGIPLVHGVVPWALSLLGPCYGWADGSPAAWILLGHVPVAAGAAVLLWLMVLAAWATGPNQPLHSISDAELQNVLDDLRLKHRPRVRYGHPVHQ